MHIGDGGSEKGFVDSASTTTSHAFVLRMGAGAYLQSNSFLLKEKEEANKVVGGLSYEMMYPLKLPITIHSTRQGGILFLLLAQDIRAIFMIS
jgi:hypothetical protein